MSAEKSNLKTIWIVDDSPTDSSRVSKALSSDYNIEIFNDGAAALEQIASGTSPDLLILDWVMPGISGLEICRYVRSINSEHPPLPIILLTAQHGSKEIVEAFRSGANDYVSKPFVDEELKSRVDSQIRNNSLTMRINQAEKEINSLLLTAPDPILTVDINGKIIFINDEGVLLFRQKRNDLIGTDVKKLIPEFYSDRIKIDSRTSVSRLAEVRIGDKTFAPMVRQLTMNNGLSSTISLRDVTERNKVESRRLDFYSIIAHDLRTPITSVLLRLQIMFRGKFGILPAGLLDDLRRMEVTLKGQVAMINDFLELAKLDDANFKLERQIVNLNDVVKLITDDFIPLIEKEKIEFENVIPKFEPIVLGDFQRLSQVFANLLGNAIKFTSHPGSIKTCMELHDNFIEVKVQDSGRGISDAEIEGLFDRFTRTEDSVAFTSGTGLGLMIVREIVEAHGGEVGVESKLGSGSLFWFKLPRYLEKV